MKVLHIAECAGGVERYLAMLLPLLERSGISQYFLCSLKYDKEKFARIVDGVEQIDLKQSFSPIYVVCMLLKIRRLIKQISPDIIYCHSSFAGALGRVAAIGLDCKVIYNPHGWAFNKI